MTNRSVVGWDIGGVNTKVARVQNGVVVAARSHPYEVQRDPQALVPLLRALAEHVGGSASDDHAVTMTAELSQMFRLKRDGVRFVIDAVSTAFPDARVGVYAVDGRFLSPSAARAEPLAVAASNWAATARMVARDHRNAILVDIGTTTTDIIAIVDGCVAAIGLTDPARLASGELVYTGALRTPVEAIVNRVPLGADFATVSAESFALVGDVHVWRGDLSPEDYTVATPDGRPATREYAGERIARVVCADRELLDGRSVSGIADAVADAQVDHLAAAIARVRDRHPSLDTAVIAGLGAFIAVRAARLSKLEIVWLADAVGDNAARSAPAAAVALLFEHPVSHRRERHDVVDSTPNARTSVVDVVVKIGGGLLAHDHLVDRVLDDVIPTARLERTLIVPGGGPFADAVRTADQQLGLDDDAAHWMAVLAMDQYAHLLASRRPSLALASTRDEITHAIVAGRVPVLAPFHWLRRADPLPHSWEVTSDSISAWFASSLGARRLVLIKPPKASGDDVVDSYFHRALAAGIDWNAVSADSVVTALRSD